MKSVDHKTDTYGDNAVEAAVEDVGDAVEEDVAEDAATDGGGEGHGGDSGDVEVCGLEGSQSTGDGEAHHADGIDEDEERLGFEITGVEAVPQEQGGSDAEDKINRQRLCQRYGGTINENIPEDPASKGGEKSSDVDAKPIETVAPGDVIATGGEGDDPESFSGLEEHGG